MNTLLSVIIVNYNTADMIEGCLDSIRSQLDERIEVIVVDNASSDSSREKIRASYPWVKLIINRKNVGFAKANNQGYSICQGRFLFFLNPDTVMQKNCFRAILTYMDRNKHIGLAGTFVSDITTNHHPTIEYTYPGHRYARKELRGLPGKIAWVLGASMIVRAQVFQETGGFDERYFLYSEDIDLCLTVRKNGWHLGYIEQAKVIHFEGGSERTSQPINVFKRKLLAEKIFFEKHYAASTVAKIMKQRRIEARWRLLTLNITKKFVQNNQHILTKIARYQTVLNVYE